MIRKRITVLSMVVVNCFALFALEVYAQEPPKIIPASPNAAALGKYGNIPVSLYNGTANITVPLYEIQSGDIKVPISLDYHTGGIRLSELAGWTGLGFVLNAGGVITRDIKNGDDLMTMGPTVRPELVSKGKITKAITMFDPFRNNVLISSKGEEFDFSDIDGTLEAYEFEYDVFNYNFLGKTGRFILNHAGEPVLEKDDDITIVPFVEDNIHRFKIIDESGFTYYFKAVEAIEREQPVSTPVVSWYLTQIESLKGYSVNFEYDATSKPQAGQLRDFDSRGCVVAMSSQTFSSMSYQNAQVLSKITFDNGVIDFARDNNREDYIGQRITGMTVTSLVFNKVLKAYTFGYSYFTAGSKRLKLESVTEQSGTIKIPPYKFSYYEPDLYIPEMLRLTSPSYDYWGYFNNGFNGAYVLPAFKGYVNLGSGDQFLDLPGARRDASPDATVFSLKQITYPTGGRTVIDLETNTYAYALEDVIEDPDPVYETKDYTVNVGDAGLYSGDIDLSMAVGTVRATVSFRCGKNDGCEEAKSKIPQEKVWFTLNNLRRDLNGGLLTCEPTSPVCSASVQYLSPGIYHWEANIDSAAKQYFSEIRCLFQWEQEKFQNGNNDNRYLYGGGLRVARITDYNENGAIVRAKHYDYHYMEDSNGDHIDEVHSYGRRTAVPFYTRYQVKVDYAGSAGNGGAALFCQSFERYSNNITTLGSVGYDQVTEYTDDKSYRNASLKSIHFFENQADSVYQYSIPAGELNGLANGVNGMHPFGIANVSYRRNGLLKQRIDYTNTSNGYAPVHETRNTWRNVILNNYYSLQLQRLDLAGSSLYLCYVYPAVRSERIELANTTEILYDPDNGTSITTQDDFTYGKKHTQQVQHTRTESSGRTVTEFKIYPPDYEGLTSTAGGVKTLLDNHVIAAPVEAYTIGRETPASPYKVLKANLTTYKTDKPLPDVIYAMEAATPPLLSSFVLSNSIVGAFSKDGRYKAKLNFVDYTSRGNVKQVAKANNANFVYQWQYNEAYPVAEVKNCSTDKFFYAGFEEATTNTSTDARTGAKSYASSYTVVLPSAGTYILTYWKKAGTAAWEFVQLNGITTNQVIGGADIKIDEVRLFPPGALMTTYTYDPLVGMTSMTDENNVTVYYEYDSLQRLSVIRDQNNNILKRYSYNYYLK